MRNQGAMLSDASVREGYVQGAVARGLESAGSNSAGAAQAFMGMGVGMGAGGNFMASASQTNAAQMERDAQKISASAQNTWKCSCGADCTGNFCQNCGSKKPMAASSWKCTCGAECTGNFCQNCGSKKPAPASDWFCPECGTKNGAASKFCQNCGCKKG